MTKVLMERISLAHAELPKKARRCACSARRAVSCNTFDDLSAGKHGFNGEKSATVLLAPGVHDFKIDYSQVPAIFLSNF